MRKSIKSASSSTPAGGLTRKDAAAYLGISTRYLDKLAAAGEIRRCKFGAKTIYRRSELDRLLERSLQRLEASNE
jgi:excisionase family DNA binding protein